MYIMILMIAVSLSMDAFSLSLAYGTLNQTKKEMIKLSIIVGVYHFFMPIIGMLFGVTLLHIFPIHPNIIVCIVLGFIGLNMIIESFKQETDIKNLTTTEMLLFGLAVSLDSFSVGIGMKAITNNWLLGSITFSLSSTIFTFLGLNLGKKINQMIGRISTIVGGIVLIIIGILYLI